jgi:hypothetical protein
MLLFFSGAAHVRHLPYSIGWDSAGLTPNPGRVGLLATAAGMGHGSCTGPRWDSYWAGARLRKEGGEK